MADPNAQDHLLADLIKEKKRDRRWKTLRFFFGFLLLFIYGSVLLMAIFPHDETMANPKKPYVSLLKLNGEIMPGNEFSADALVPELTKAFKDTNARGVVLLVNSPGGSPVQSAIIHDKIIELKHKYHKPVAVVAEDMLASGAYLIATAADKIYVNQDTITGSIGVIMNGFGMDDAIKKIGINRRVFTAGTNKDRLDPFKPLRPQDIAKVKTLLGSVHNDFINYVKAGRGNKLDTNNPDLFSGDFWTGSQAVKLGLADGTANLWSVLNQQFKVDQYRDYSVKPPLFASLMSGMRSELNLHLLSNPVPVRAELQL